MAAASLAPASLAASAAVAAAFALVHVAGPGLRFLQRTPRSVWLSAAGGVSVAYVFVHLLPELAGQQARISGSAGAAVALERHVYLIALLGLATFYGLDRLVRHAASRQAERGGERRAGASAFWIHLGAFAVYSALIGYLLVHREEADARGLALYGAAMALHFVVNDQGLRQQHGELYDRRGRWLLAAAPLVGWGIGLAGEAPPLLVGALFGFLAGGVVLNVLKEELPEDRQSRFWAFAAGASAYAAILLVST